MAPLINEHKGLLTVLLVQFSIRSSLVTKSECDTLSNPAYVFLFPVFREDLQSPPRRPVPPWHTGHQPRFPCSSRTLDSPFNSILIHYSVYHLRKHPESLFAPSSFEVTSHFPAPLYSYTPSKRTAEF